MIGFVGNNAFSKSFRDLTDRLIQALTDVLGVIDDIQTKLSDKSATASVLGDASALQDNAQKFRTTVLDLDSRRSWVMLGAFALPILGIFAAFLSMMTKKGPLCWFYVLLAFLSLFVNWISFSAHLATRMVLTDLCTDVAKWLTAPTEYTINNVIQCIGSDASAAVRTSAMVQAEDNVKQYNQQSLSPKPLTIPAGLYSTNAVTLKTACADVSAQVAYQRANSLSLGPTTVQFLDLIDAAIAVLPAINDIQTCKLISSVVADIKVLLCDKIGGAILLIIVAHGIIGVVLLPGTVFGVQGINRFSQRGENMTALPSKLDNKPAGWVAPVYVPQYARNEDEPVELGKVKKQPSKASLAGYDDEDEDNARTKRTEAYDEESYYNKGKGKQKLAPPKKSWAQSYEYASDSNGGYGEEGYGGYGYESSEQS